MSRIVPRPTESAFTDASIDLEAIVRRVLLQLRRESAIGDTESREQTSAATSFLFEAGVCSLDDVQALSASIKHLQLSARTVITPAARDELRYRGITVTKADATGDANSKQVNSEKIKVQSGSRAINLQCDGVVADHLLAAVKKQVLNRGVRLCNQSSLEVVLSSRPATTAHQRTGPDRCVVAINRVDDVQRFMAELSPNTFVLDVAHLHLVALANAIAAIAKPTSRTIPKVTMAGGLS